MNSYLKNLSRKRMAAGVVFFNEKDELLVVKISYKNYWSIPGGVIEENESPKQACVREIKEEIALEIDDIMFLCVDYNAADRSKDKDESLQFIFYGGKLDEEKIRHIKIDGKEIVEYRFVSLEEAQGLLGGVTRSLVRRLPKCLEAIKQNKGFYLEEGI